MTDKKIRKATKIWLIAQIAVSLLTIAFGVGYAIRCATAHTNIIPIAIFGCIAYVGYKLMLRASIAEYREARKNSRI